MRLAGGGTRGLGRLQGEELLSTGQGGTQPGGTQPWVGYRPGRHTAPSEASAGLQPGGTQPWVGYRPGRHTAPSEASAGLDRARAASR
jgi:hypothetical protein